MNVLLRPRVFVILLAAFVFGFCGTIVVQHFRGYEFILDWRFFGALLFGLSVLTIVTNLRYWWHLDDSEPEAPVRTEATP